MKTIVLLFMLVFVVEYVSSNNILSKFHQNKFKIKDVRIQLMSFDKKIYNNFQIIAFKYNRTTTAHNITMNYKLDVKDKLEFLVQVYKFLSNEYREVAIRFQANLQKAYEENVIGIADTIKCGNLTTCYFYKDITYHACNFVVDETRFPPLIPSGKYKVEIQYLYLQNEVAVINMFGEVYTPIDYPKK